MGLFLSIAIYAVIGYTLSNCDIFFKKYPRIFNEEASFEINPPILFQNSIIAFSVIDDSGNHYSDPSLFSITVNNGYYQTNFLQEQNLDPLYIDNKTLDYCANVDYSQQMIQNLAMGNFLCLKNNTFLVEGFFDEPILKMLSITISICDNITMNNSCQSRENIASFFKGKRFSFFYADNNLDFQNYQQPITPKVHNDFQLLNSKLQKVMNLYYKKVTLMTDDGLFVSNQNTIDTFVVDSKETDFDFIDDINEENIYFMLSVFSTSKAQRIERYYQNVSELFSVLGGLLNSLIVLGFFLSYVEKSLYLTKKIMNRLYTFQPEKRLKTKEIVTIEMYRKEREEKFDDPSIIQQIKPVILPSMEDFKSEKMIFMSKSSSNIDNSKDRMSYEDKEDHIKASRILENDLENENPDEKISELEKKNEEIMSNNILKKAEEDSKETKKVDFDDNNKSKDENSNKSQENNIPNIDRKESKDKSWFSFQNIRRRLKGFTLINKKTVQIKQETVQNLEKFQDFQDSKNKIQINLLSFLKLQCSRVFCCKKTFNERLYLKAENIFSKELDIVTILRKLQELEKLKMVLLNDKQLILFNVLAKPLVYLDKEKISHTGGGYTMAEVMSSTLKNKGLKEAVEFYDNKENLRGFNDVDRRLIKMLDNNVKDFMNYFQA